MSFIPPPLTYEELFKRLHFDASGDVQLELEQGATLLQMVAEEAARQGQIMNEKKVELKAIEAVTLLEIRKANNASGKKTTVDEVSAEVDSNQGVVDARLAYGAAEREYESWYGLKQSFKERQEALRAAVQCILSGYIAHAKAGVR